MTWNSKNGVFLIAEIGGNHEGNFEYALKLTHLACQSGADAVKFQIYTGDSLVNKKISNDRYEHFKKFELTQNQHLSLAELCSKYGVAYLASVWDINAIEWLDPYLKFYKIGSGDLTSYTILKKIALIGKPIILSTGLCTMDEIEESTKYIQSVNPLYKNKNYLALLQCTSMYPIPDSDANLKVIPMLKAKLGITVGYSDHTVGATAAQMAVALGAEIIEIHFTDSRENKSFRDHQVSFTKQEVQILIEDIKKIKTLMGSEKKNPTLSEIQNGHIQSFRRAVYPKIDIEAGTIINENHLIVLRPNVGIDARDYSKVIGRKLKKSVNALESMFWDIFE